MVSKILMISLILMLVALIVYIIGFSTRYFIALIVYIIGFSTRYFIALIVYIIGFSTRYFIDTDQPPYKVYYGLWVACVSKPGQMICKDTAEVPNLGNRGWFKAWRATSILGLIFLFAAIICTGLKLFAFKEKKYILITGIGMTFAAVVFILAAVIVLTENVEDVPPGLPFKYGFSFALTIVGMCIAGISAGFMVVEYCMGVHK